MSGSLFKKATRKQSRLRMALVGPSGSGKTLSALRIAFGLGRRIAVIDTERGSASKYANYRNELDFDVLELAMFHPRNYIGAMEAAASEGYEVIVIDSLSHAWTGRGGVLEIHDAATVRHKGNSFGGWREATPVHNELIDGILNCPAHVIATMRAKVDYVVETDAMTGRSTPRKVGLAPVQREGMDYEFDIVADIDLDHKLIVGKTRWDAIDRLVLTCPGPDFGRKLATWLNDGETAEDGFDRTAAIPAPDSVNGFGPPRAASPPIAALPTRTPAPAIEHVIPDAPTPSPPVEAEAKVTPAMIDRITALILEAELTPAHVKSAMERRRILSFDQLTIAQAAEMIDKLEDVVDRNRFADRVACGGLETSPYSRSSVEANGEANGPGADDADPADSFEIPDVSRRPESKAAAAKRARAETANRA